MPHTIQIVVSVVIDGEPASWSAEITTDLNPYDIARTATHGIRDQAGKDLLNAADHYRAGLPVQLAAV